ncbi:hypothetical protein BH23CHL8_BH23CHL8_12740 [soil metagenome]
MRTTIDLPDELYRTLKARAALTGSTLRDVIHELITQGMRQPPRDGPRRGGTAEGPPVVITPQNIPIPAVDAAQRRRIEELEDEARLA